MAKLFHTSLKALFLVLLAINPAYSQSNRLTMGAISDLPPVSYEQNNTWVGIDVDIMREACKNLGYKLTIKGYPFTRISAEINAGNIDGIVGTFDDNDASHVPKIKSVTPAYHSTISLFALEDRATKDRTLNNISLKNVSDYRAGMIRSSYFTQKFGRVDFKSLTTVNTYKQLIAMLHGGRIDIAIAEDIPFLYFAKKMELINTFKALSAIEKTPIVIGFSIRKHGEKTAQLANEFSIEITRLMQNGTIDKIINSYQ